MTLSSSHNWTERNLMIARILLHLRCPCRSWKQVWFHVAGIVREFLPKKLQRYLS